MEGELPNVLDRLPWLLTLPLLNFRYKHLFKKIQMLLKSYRGFHYSISHPSQS